MSLSNAARRGILAAHGIVPGPDGYDLNALVRLVDQRGWHWSSARVTNSGRLEARWRVTIFASRAGEDRTGSVQGARGRGATEAEALAGALATLLHRAADGRPAQSHDSTA